MKYTFLGVTRFLKSVSRSTKPIKVRRTELIGLDGCCEEYDDYFLIKVHKSLENNYSIDVLLHEVAHADAWGMDKDVHGRNWGIQYSRLYRLLLDKYFN
jgi:hypothetical protein